MTTALSPVTITRLEKAAIDNGFDQELPREGDWIGFTSTQCPLRIWLGSLGDAVFLATFSQQNVARALGQYGTPMEGLHEGHRAYLPWHRERVFERGVGRG